jgi:hypothetical protein
VHEEDPIHVYVPGGSDDPRDGVPSDPDLVIHRGPPLHPDDVAIGPGGIPMTSVSRTLIDLAEVMDADQLRVCFERASELGLLDLDELEASRARVEWRPSLAMFDEILDEYRGRM